MGVVANGPCRNSAKGGRLNDSNWMYVHTDMEPCISDEVNMFVLTSSRFSLI